MPLPPPPPRGTQPVPPPPPVPSKAPPPPPVPSKAPPPPPVPSKAPPPPPVPSKAPPPPPVASKPQFIVTDLTENHYYQNSTGVIRKVIHIDYENGTEPKYVTYITLNGVVKGHKAIAPFKVFLASAKTDVTRSAKPKYEGSDIENKTLAKDSITKKQDFKARGL